MIDGNLPALIELIYEAAIVPQRWPNVLAELTAISEGAFASIFVQRDGQLRWLGTREADVLIGEYAALNRPDLNTRIPRLLARRYPGFITDLDVFTPDEIAAEPFYRDFMHPRGYGWVAARLIGPPSGETIVVSVERRLGRGTYEPSMIARLDELGPHLARAGLLAARLNLERVRAMADALQGVGLPSAVLQHGGKVVAANTLFDELVPDVLQDRSDRLHAADAAADALFDGAVARLGRRSDHVGVSSIPVAASGDRPPQILHLVPVCGSAHDIFASATALLVVTPVDRSQVPSAEVLQGLFDLTPAEARIARGIGEAQTIEALAQALQVSRETVRTQVKAVLAKTGASRQSDLVSLLAGGKQAFR